MKFVNRQSVWVFGLVSGGFIGLLGAPPWEMAGLFVGIFGALTGAVSAQCAAYSGKGIIGSFLATVIGSGTFLLLAYDNPSHIVVASVLLVAASGVVGCGMGFVVRIAVR